MPVPSSAAYPFGDLLALARQSWLGQMASRLAEFGYDDYRRTDAAAIWLLQRGPVPVGQLGTALGVTRQAARKVADGLDQRGYATIQRDPDDARQLKVALTAAGQEYSSAVVAVIDQLNREAMRRTDPAELSAADAVLRAAMFDDSARWRAGLLPPPPAATPGPAGG